MGLIESYKQPGRTGGEVNNEQISVTNGKPTLVIGAALGALLFSAGSVREVLAADLPAGFKAGELAPAPPADMIEAGKRVYFTKCVWCHGVDGAGDGPGADRLWPRPRNFNQGTFKIRHTASGELPLFNYNERSADSGKNDLFDTVTHGFLVLPCRRGKVF